MQQKYEELNLLIVTNTPGLVSLVYSRFLGNIKEAFDKNPNLTNLLLDDFFKKAIIDCQVRERHRGYIKGITLNSTSICRIWLSDIRKAFRICYDALPNTMGKWSSWNVTHGTQNRVPLMPPWVDKRLPIEWQVMQFGCGHACQLAMQVTMHTRIVWLQCLN